MYLTKAVSQKNLSPGGGNGKDTHCCLSFDTHGMRHGILTNNNIKDIRTDENGFQRSGVHDAWRHYFGTTNHTAKGNRVLSFSKPTKRICKLVHSLLNQWNGLFSTKMYCNVTTSFLPLTLGGTLCKLPPGDIKLILHHLRWLRA